MSDLETCHVRLEETPGNGAWNMAVDEAMLLDAIESGRHWLRLYRWAEPTLSLGYFQSPEERTDDPLIADLPWVRRLSGGGAIVHHHEWTYSCALPAQSRFSREPIELYTAVHRAIVEVLAARGAAVRFRGLAQDDAPGTFLCFARGDVRDLVVDHEGRPHKILGSAQRRRRGAVLQHGSLLLGTSPHAPAHLGLFDLFPEFDGQGLERDLAVAISDRLSPSRTLDVGDRLNATARDLLAVGTRSERSGTR